VLAKWRARWNTDGAGGRAPTTAASTPEPWLPADSAADGPAMRMVAASQLAKKGGDDGDGHAGGGVEWAEMEPAKTTLGPGTY